MKLDWSIMEIRVLKADMRLKKAIIYVSSGNDGPKAPVNVYLFPIYVDLALTN
jgi:hypothetical protein